MSYLNGWHPFESIRFDLEKNTMWRWVVSSDLGATKTASTKTKSNSIIAIYESQLLYNCRNIQHNIHSTAMCYCHLI